jgi:hypothetical protein
MLCVVVSHMWMTIGDTLSYQYQQGAGEYAGKRSVASR